MLKVDIEEKPLSMGEIVAFLFNTTVKQKHAFFADISPFKDLKQVGLISD